MKILVAYPNKENYSETFIQNQLHYLKPEHTLTGGWRAYIDENNKSFFNFPLSELIRIFIKRILPFWYAGFYTHFLTKYLKKVAPDCILAEYGITGCTILKACQKLNIPLVVHFHGFDASDKPTLDKYGKAYKEVFDYAKAIVVVSKDMKQALINLGAPEAKLKLIPYGVNTTLFGEKKEYSDNKVVITVGRFAYKKAPDLTIKAFKRVLEQEANATLIMVGEGELWGEAKKLVKKLEIQEKVDFKGIQPPQEVVRLLQNADIFVQHSVVSPITGDSEGTPNSVLEATSVGLPVVSTLHGGIKEAVDHGKTGFLVEEGDYEGMADYICDLLANPEKAQEMGRNGRVKVEDEYSIENQIGKLHKVLSV